MPTGNTVLKRSARTVACLLGTAAGTAHAQYGPLQTALTGSIEARGLMFDLTALHPAGLWVGDVQLNTNAPQSSVSSGEVWVREGSFIGHTMSAEGWVRLENSWGYSGGPGAWGPFYICPRTPLRVAPGATVGVFLAAGVPQLYSPIPPAQSAYATPEIQLSGGVAKASGSFTDPDLPNAMINIRFMYHLGTSCYANCDYSVMPPTVNVLDFACFLGQVAGGSPYANCDCSTRSPVINVLDYMCFLNQFAAGCSAP